MKPSFYVTIPLLGFSALLLGGIVIFGWYANIPALIQVHPTFAPMQYNTALGFILGGIGLMAGYWSRSRITYISGTLLTVLASLTVTQYVLGINLGIDQLFMDAYITVKTSHPGRMAPNTAFSFFLTGIAVLILGKTDTHQKNSLAIAILGGSIFALGISALGGYLIGMETAYGWGNLTRMAVHTASEFMVLGLAIVIFAWKADTTAEKLIPRWTPILIGMGTITITLLIWQAVNTNEVKAIKKEIEINTQHIKSKFISALEEQAFGITRQVKLWEAIGAPTGKDWLINAEIHIGHHTSVRSIEWVDPDFIVRWIAPLKGNEKAIDLDLSRFKDHNASLIQARDKRKLMVSHTRKLVRGGSGFFIIVPIYHEGRFSGFIESLVNPGQIINHLSNNLRKKGFNLWLAEEDKSETRRDDQWFYSTPVKFHDNTWDLMALPGPEWIKSKQSKTPTVVLVIGIIVSILLALLARLVQRNRDHVHAVKKAKAKLSDAYNFLEAQGQIILNNLVDSLITIDEKGTIDIFNPAAERAFGYASKEVTGKNIKMLMPEPYCSEHDTYLDNYKKTKQAKVIGIGREVMGKRKDGSLFPIDLSVNEFKVKGKKAYVGICRDITERKQAQEKIEQANTNLKKKNWLVTHLKKISDKMRGDQDRIELAQNIISSLTKDLQASRGVMYLIEGNKLKVAARYGFARQEEYLKEFMIGEGLLGKVALEKQRIILNDVAEDHVGLASGLGDALLGNIMIVPLLHENNVMSVVELGFPDPITDEQVEFIDKAEDGIAIALNSALARKQMQELLTETQAQAEELVSQKEELEQIQEELQQSNQSLERQAQSLLRQRDQIEEKNELVKSKIKELEMAGRYKSEFLANMSHELRTPLNSLLILSQLLSENKTKNLTDKQVEFARTIHSSGSDLLDLISDILDLSKVEAGKMELILEEVSLAKLSESLKRTFLPIAEQKKLDFRIEISEGMPDAIRTDFQRVEQVIKNFMSNAFKFTETGGITLRIHRVDDEVRFSRKTLNASNAVGISVTDTGKGIPQDKQDHIFEAFQQEDGTTSRKFGGTGLGLSISKSLSHLLAGEIHIKSEEGVGSTFTMYLPENHPTPKEKKDTANTLETKPVSPKTYLKKPTSQLILIIEDDPHFSKIISATAKENGFDSIVAGDGKLGIELAKKIPIAIILDVTLPGIDGLEVIEQLKADVATQNIPVYIVSAHHDKAREALEKGAEDFIEKPLSLEKLQAVLAKIVKSSGKTNQILIVEDDEDVRDSMIGLLSGRDINILTATSVEEAIEQLREHPVNCMTVDLGLNGKSGFDLLHEIKNDKTLPNVPVIIYTGESLSISQEEELAYFTKTVIIKGKKSPQRLLDEIDVFLIGMNQTVIEKDPLNEESSTTENVEESDEISPDDMDTLFRSKKVLLADDDMRNVFALTHLLEEKEVNVIVARTGREAVDVLKSNPDTDLVLMDIMMPEMDGYEAMQEIRKDDKFSRTPIIAITAKAMKSDKKKCMDSGASDYLTKPIDQSALFNQMSVWLQRESKDESVI